MGKIRYRDKRTGQWRKPVMYSEITGSEYYLVAYRMLRKYKAEVMKYRDHMGMRELHLDLKVNRYASELERHAAASKTEPTDP